MTDTKGVDPAQCDRDVAERQTFARKISQGQSAANGAIAGAILGLIVEAAFGIRHGNLGSVVAGAAANFSRINSGTVLFAPPPTDSGNRAVEKQRDP
jgi:hypothetical protein